MWFVSEVVDVRGGIDTGALGECIAADYLALAGCRIIGRNVRSGHLEIDLVVEDGDCLAFVEVKTRMGRSFGEAREAVRRSKLLNVRRAAAQFLSMKASRRLYREIRFDVIAIDVNRSRDAMMLRHLKGIT